MLVQQTTQDELVQELAIVMADALDGQEVYVENPDEDYECLNTSTPGRSEEPTENVVYLTVGGRKFAVQLWEVK